MADSYTPSRLTSAESFVFSTTSSVISREEVYRLAEPDACTDDPFITRMLVRSIDGSTAKLYRTRVWPKASSFRDFLVYINCSILVFVQGFFILFLIGWYLPGFISIPLLLSYFGYVVLTQSHFNGTSGWSTWQQSKGGMAILEYFSMGLLVEDGVEFDQDRPYVIGLHPHGAHMLGSTMITVQHEHNAMHKLFPGIFTKTKCAAATIMFYIPFVREMLLWSGWIDVSKKVVSKVLKNGGNVAIVVGGEAEALATENGKDKIVLGGRKGFIKLALQHGADIVPTYTFFNQEAFMFHHKLLVGPRNWIQRNFKIALPFVWGWLGTPFPKPVPMVFVLGPPIAVPKVDPDAPLDEGLVNDLHTRYCDEIRRLFYSYKSAAGYHTERELEILDAPEASKQKTQ